MTLLIFSAVVVNEASRQLAATIALVLKRADLTIDYVSRVTGIPPNKLSDQLAGKVPFTGLCRILASDELRSETEFWPEFIGLCAKRVGCIVATIEDVVHASKRHSQREQAV